MGHWVRLGLVVSGLAASSNAAAAPPDDVWPTHGVPVIDAQSAAPEPAPTEGTTETSVLGGVGIVGGDSMGGAALSLLALHRFEWLELGLDGQAAGMVAGMWSVGGMAGLHLGDDVSVRLLASVGWHAYGGVGRDLFFGGDPGVSGSTPYVGGRLLLGRSLSRLVGKRHRGFLGALVAVDDDLRRATKSVTYAHDPWLWGEVEQRTESHGIGQLTLGAFFIAGVELDLASY